MKTKILKIQGVVQGVGFRPFIKKLADKLDIQGVVYNNSNGVTVVCNVTQDELKEFINKIKTELPSIAHIINIDIEDTGTRYYNDFQIIESEKVDGVTLISPDVATCKKCRNEILDIGEKRFLYPFTNCTNCGPRYSIIKEIPYDRPNTTMNSFEMCDTCYKEYSDINDRRYHAQPIACFDCGPKIFAEINDTIIDDNEEAFLKIAELIDNGEIVAIKGLGGYHLIVDGTNSKAIERLRNIKKRSTKPFALMVENVDTIKDYINISEKNEKLLKSNEAPIVIFEWTDSNSKSHNKEIPIPFAENVAPFSNKIGIMLAYTPLHIILFHFLKTKFIVATSGNMKDEPIAKSVDEARLNLSSATKYFLHHNRDIHTRIDDSVVTLINNKNTNQDYSIIRRARGYAPIPVSLKNNTGTEKDVFACGANLKSSIAFYKDGYGFLSQYIGDLDNIYNEEMYKEIYNNMIKMFNLEPEMAVTDNHDQYRSTIFTKEKYSHVKSYQHHVCHFASNLAENSHYGNALGVVMDGFGIGLDNKAWGGEIFLKNNNVITRLAHIKNYVQPGLDAAAKDPIRMMISYLYSEKLLDKIEKILIDNKLSTSKEITLVKMAIDNKLNSIETSAAGRLFEAVGSLVLQKRNNEYEGELAILLENYANSNIDESYQFIFNKETNEIELNQMLQELVSDILSGKSKNIIATKFHNGFSNVIAETVVYFSKIHKIEYVSLSGGVMQNMKLLNNIMNKLKDNGIKPLIHKYVPANDAGIALGQLYCYLNNVENN